VLSRSDCAIPFGLNSRQMTAWMYDGNGMKLMREFYAKVQHRQLPRCGNTGAQMGGWYRKEIKSVADIKGLKFRVGGFGGKVLDPAGRGAAEHSLAAKSTRRWRKGTIDAAEWVGPYDDLKLGFNKVAPYYYYPGWWEGGPQLTLYVNQKSYEGLSSEYKAIIECAAAYAHTDMQAKYDVKNPIALKQLVGQGVKVLPFPKDVMAAAFKSAQEVYAELNASNPAWKKIYDDWSVYRRDANLWFRFPEASFDDFMQAQKL
jgi:TRAP-type mannitol/chloroaromatic compound transport system substrate-binding protein